MAGRRGRCHGAGASVAIVPGHEVVQHLGSNAEALARGSWFAIRSLWEGAWSASAYRAAREVARRARPDIVKVHNWWFVLSPSVLAAFHDEGCPVVARLANFRTQCAAAVLMDGRGRPCQDCVGRAPWRGVLRRCYHHSVAASAAVARMIWLNRRRRTWEKDVDLLTVPSRFSREVLARGGIPEDRIAIEPDLVEAPMGQGAEPEAAGGGRLQVLFVGRLSEEKGVRTLLQAWPRVEAATPAELLLVGEGPLEPELRRAASNLRVRFSGALSGEAVFAELRRSALLVLPSQCYETFGRVVVEAFAMGRPTVVSDLGSLAGLVRHGETGLRFASGDAEDLAAKAIELLQDGERRLLMGRAARAEYQREHSPEQTYERLMDSFRRAREAHAQHA